MWIEDTKNEIEIIIFPPGYFLNWNSSNGSLFGMDSASPDRPSIISPGGWVAAGGWLALSPTAVKFNIGLYQLYIFNIPSWVSFGHFYMSFHKCLSGMPYILRKNISKFVFENSWFQIADAFQSLLCDGRFAAVVNKSRRCWATIVISSLFLWNQQKTCNG